MTTTLRSVCLVAALVIAAIAAPLGIARPATAKEVQCSTSVIYDQFRFNNETVSQAANGSATASAQNTKVTVEQAPGFVRINGSNPNGYCVEYRVRLNASIVSPAELGEVDSNDDSVTAEWHAVRDFSRDQTYTEVVFTLPAGSQATFAPSTVRVESLAWTGEAKSAGGSLWESLPDLSLGDDEPLEQRTYTFNATNSTDTITISLQNGSTDRTVNEWQAMYRTNNHTEWRPVGTDTADPVYYRMVDEHRVQFIFNDQSGEVRFTANPTFVDKADHSWDAYWAGENTITDTLAGLFD